MSEVMLMFTYEDRIVINRPVSEVFSFFFDQAKFFEWRQDVLKHEMITPGPFAKGSRWVEHAENSGQKSIREAVLLDLVPDKLFDMISTFNHTSFHSVYVFEAVPEG